MLSIIIAFLVISHLSSGAVISFGMHSYKRLSTLAIISVVLFWPYHIFKMTKTTVNLIKEIDYDQDTRES